MAEVKEIIDATGGGTVSVVALGDGQVEVRVEKGVETFDPDTGLLYETRTVNADDLGDAVIDAVHKHEARAKKAAKGKG